MKILKPIAGLVACSLISLSACRETPSDPETPPTSPETAKGVSMTNGQGKEYTLTLRPLSDSRDYLYCELIFDYGEKGLDIYSTSMQGEPSLEWWDNIDLEALAKGFGAKTVRRNGPQRWSMDEVSMMLSEPIEVAGVKMAFGGHLPPGTAEIPAYQVFNPAKYQYLVWKAGRPVYQLVDPEGHVYVLQGYKVQTGDLAHLGEKLKTLPDDWEFRISELEEDLVMDLTPAEPIPSVPDELDQYWIRIPKSK